MQIIPDPLSSRAVRRLIVHEKTSHWTATLEREWGGSRPVQIRWRPYQAELQAEIMNHDVALFVVEPDESSLELLSGFQAIACQTAIICFIEEEHQDWEFLAREFGVKAILPLTSPYPEMLKLLEKFMDFES